MLPGTFPLGPFLVEETGRLSFRLPGQEAAFAFVWRGRRFFAQLRPGRIALKGVIGAIPSSANGAGQRREALACLRALPPLMPPGWALRLAPDHRLHVHTAQELDWPAHASDLMLPLLRFLLLLAPYLDLIDESGLRAA